MPILGSYRRPLEEGRSTKMSRSEESGSGTHDDPPQESHVEETNDAYRTNAQPPVGAAESPDARATTPTGSPLTLAEPILTFLDAKLFHGRWWWVAITAFSVYYVGSAIAAWFAGTLYSSSMIVRITSLIGFDAAIRTFSGIEPVRSGKVVPLLSDFAHLNFSFLICVVAFPLAFVFLHKIPLEFRTYFDLGIPQVDRAEKRDLFEDFYSRATRPWNVAIAAAFGLFAGSTFILLARSVNPEAARWWGNIKFGYAGYYLAFAQGLCCYFALWGFELMLDLNRSIRRAASMTETFHPFHQDGYYGLEPLARLLVWQAGLILLAGVALFSTFYMGYFGLETLPLIFVSMIVFTVGTGLFLALPLVSMTRHVRDLRNRALADLEPHIQHMAVQAREGRLDGESTEWFVAMMQLHQTIKASRTFPFGLASLNSVIIGYGLQVAVLVKQFYAHYR